jgi:hydroxybutyrate-dimer hydrolase
MLGRIPLGAAALALTVGTAAAGGPGGEGAGPGKPGFIHGEVLVTRYPGSAGTDDLLTAGLGAAGLAGTAPPVSQPPTAAELRRLAIYSNYRALVDMTVDGGYGRLYGPTVPPTTATPEGKVFGVEYLAFAKGRGGDQNITLMVQIPEAFPAEKPCIVAAPSSGSRGVYGAIGTAGEWGLKKGCAVAYADKGTGIGAHNLARDTVGRITGERVDADVVGELSSFTATLSDTQREAFNRRHPNRWAFKHAHSQDNPEADWDEHVVLSLRFALWAVNHALAQATGRPSRLGWDETLVIASSVSNGGAASLRAAEIAPPGMIDAVVVSEPNVNPRHDGRFSIRQGNGTPLRAHSRPLYDYLTLIDVYQGCANLANPTAPLNVAAFGENRCTALAQAGLLEGADTAARAAEAQRIVNRYGLLPEANVVAPSYWAFYVQQAVSATYANAYGRASVLDRLCGFSFAATDAAGKPAALSEAVEATLFGTANGIPPTGGIDVVNDRSAGTGPLRDPISVSRSSGLPDQNLDGALCLRSLVKGRARTPETRRFQPRVREGIREILASGRLHGIPAIVLHGRNDALIAPNHSSRPYYALSRLADGRRSKITYVEVTNAQHFDAFLALAGYSDKFVPLHAYFIEAMDLMWAHLTDGKPLPKSQVVRTIPRGVAGGVVPPLRRANLPPILIEPDRSSRIAFDGRQLRIPD